MIDVLEKLYKKELTLDEIYDLIDDITESKYPIPEGQDISDFMGYSDREWQASCFGIPLFTIAQWRYEGWPQYCYKCGKPIFYEIQYIYYLNNKPLHIGCGPMCDKVGFVEEDE